MSPGRLLLLIVALWAILSHSGLAAQGKKSAAATGAPSARFVALLEAYRHGDADAAVAALAQWKEHDVKLEAVLPSSADPALRAAAVGLLTEAGMRKGLFGKFAEDSPRSIFLKTWGLDQNFEPYAYHAYLFVKNLTGLGHAQHDDIMQAFAGRWYVVAISYCARFGCPGTLDLQAMADHDLIDRPEVALLIGSLNEPHAGPFVPHPEPAPGCTPEMAEGPDGCMYKWNEINDTDHPNPTREALWCYRHALKADPTLVEAHLRLGRMLFLINFAAEAREHLERAFADAQARKLEFLAYMAGLYLGELNGHEGRWKEAVDDFTVSVSLAPTSHLANVAYGEAMLRSGDREGWTEARRMFADEPTSSKPIEPATYYREAQYWRATSDLKLLREIARTWPGVRQ